MVCDGGSGYHPFSQRISGQALELRFGGEDVDVAGLIYAEDLAVDQHRRRQGSAGAEPFGPDDFSCPAREQPAMPKSFTQ